MAAITVVSENLKVFTPHNTPGDKDVLLSPLNQWGSETLLPFLHYLFHGYLAAVLNVVAMAKANPYESNGINGVSNSSDVPGS